MLKRSLLALAACLVLAAPAFAADQAPGTANRTCYSITAPGMTGQYTLTLVARFSKTANHLVARATCARATMEPAIKSWVRGNYFPLNKSMTVVGEGYPTSGKNASGEEQANVLFDFTVPFDGGTGTGMFACRPDKGDWAKYEAATVTKIECMPIVKPAK